MPVNLPTPGPEEVEAPEHPQVYLEQVRHWIRQRRGFNAYEYYQEFRFANLDRIAGFAEAMVAIDAAIQNLLDDINTQAGPEDFVQLRLDAQGLNQPLFSLRRPREDLNTAHFLNNLVSVLQSNAELVGTGVLRLVVTIIRNRAGGAARSLKTLTYSKIIEKKNI